MASTSPRTVELVRDVMTRNPITLEDTTTIRDAAQAMRERDVGDVLVVRDQSMYGIVTDRDIVVRSDADGCDPNRTTIGEICSRYLSQVGPEQPIDRAVAVMRETAVRRLPVVDGEVLVGIVSLGDLAEVRDPQSARSGISGAQSNT
jgi:CBS domain-containing protein